jgi:hypothetical protein
MRRFILLSLLAANNSPEPTAGRALEITPVVSAETAVRVQIVKDFKKSK